MREHQITITLQAEHFQEIQRLARTAGARSVGTYARDKLLSALNLTIGSPNLTARRAQDLTSVTGEMRRLHRELQIFIAESLSTKDYGYVVNGAAPGHSEGGGPALGVAAQKQSLENTSIQIKLNQSTSSAGEATTQNDVAGDRVDNFNQSQSTSDSSGTISDTSTTLNVEQSSENMVESESELQEYSQSAREAEDLAERAFVISPRLGAIEEFHDDPMDFSDPLDELLNETESGTNVSDELLPDETAASVGELPHSTQNFESDEWPLDEQDAQLARTANSDDEVVEQLQEQNQQNIAENVTENVTTPPPSVADPAERPPLSGGPPPRKRRT